MDLNRKQRSVALTGSGSRASGPRRAVQIVLGVLSWIGFVLLWIWQLEVYVPSTWLYSICLIALILAAWVVLTICWVRWNINIYARRHGRTAPVRMEVAFDEDSLGRPIRASGGIRAAEGQIIVSVDSDGAKTYEPARRRLLPRLPTAKELLPDWDSIPVSGDGRVAVNGNGNGHRPQEVNGNGNGNGHRPEEEVRERIEELP